MENNCLLKVKKRLENHKILKNKSYFLLFLKVWMKLHFPHCFVTTTSEFSCIYVGHCVGQGEFARFYTQHDKL